LFCAAEPHWNEGIPPNQLKRKDIAKQKWPLVTKQRNAGLGMIVLRCGTMLCRRFAI
jgi:hypothetical protein